MATATRVDRQLATKIEELGELRSQLAQLQAAERQLSADVRDRMVSEGLDVVESKTYIAQLARQSRLTVEPAKLLKLVGQKALLECVRVDLKAARRFCGEQELEKIGCPSERVILRISEKVQTR